jgi:hypothetical protein
MNLFRFETVELSDGVLVVRNINSSKWGGGHTNYPLKYKVVAKFYDVNDGIRFAAEMNGRAKEWETHGN